MIINDAGAIADSDIANFAWSGLRVFRNVDHTTNAILRQQGVPGAEKRNVQKQARQIRHCLIQAEEYARAAEAVSSATRPTLQYYSIMMLATAEILFKGTGDVSLDKARHEHGHHGLAFSTSVSGAASAKANELLARPVSFGPGGNRRGTFELWHAISRPTPICGTLVDHLENAQGSITHPVAVIFRPLDSRTARFPDDGHTLLHCMQHLPGLAPYLGDMGAAPLFARATVRLERNTSHNVRETRVTLHPTSNELVARVSECCTAEPPEALTRLEMPRGAIYIFNPKLDDKNAVFSAPNGVSLGEYTYFWPYSDDAFSLNYFGWIYACAFILGNYARYYPDKWIKDIEEATYLAAAADAFYRIATAHAPLAILSELSRKYLVPTRNHMVAL